MTMHIHDLNFMEPAHDKVTGGFWGFTSSLFNWDSFSLPLVSYALTASNTAEAIAPDGGAVVAQGSISIGDTTVSASATALSLPMVEDLIPAPIFDIFDTWI